MRPVTWSSAAAGITSRHLTSIGVTRPLVSGPRQVSGPFRGVREVDAHRASGEEGCKERRFPRLPRPEERVDVGAPQMPAQNRSVPPIKHALYIHRPFINLTLFLSPIRLEIARAAGSARSREGEGQLRRGGPEEIVHGHPTPRHRLADATQKSRTAHEKK